MRLVQITTQDMTSLERYKNFFVGKINDAAVSSVG
jgi:hypothetical protein